MEDYSLIRIMVSFALVVALIGVFALIARWVAKKYPSLGVSVGGGRLQMIESRMLDAKHKLVLVRCDTREHLLLLGPQNECVIESKDVANV